MCEMLDQFVLSCSRDATAIPLCFRVNLCASEQHGEQSENGQHDHKFEQGEPAGVKRPDFHISVGYRKDVANLRFIHRTDWTGPNSLFWMVQSLCRARIRTLWELLQLPRIRRQNLPSRNDRNGAMPGRRSSAIAATASTGGSG